MRKNLKELIIEGISRIRTEKKEEAVMNLIESFKEGLAELGFPVNITPKINEEFPPEMEKFIDMLRGGRAKIFNLMEGLEDLKEMKEMETDSAIKEVGDTVVTLGKHTAVYMHDFETKEQLSSNKEMPKISFKGLVGIVVDANANFTFNCGHCDNLHQSDLVVHFSELGRSFHVKSDLVKIVPWQEGN